MDELQSLRDWAHMIRKTRRPDVIIGGDYLLRWFVVPRNAWQNVYLHEFRRSDDPRALHDHPWDNASLLLEGEYLEHTPSGVLHRKVGDHVVRQAADAHRIELIDGQPAVSLFTTGPRVREWGFHCPQGWRHWEEFCDTQDKHQIGRGCD